MADVGIKVVGMQGTSGPIHAEIDDDVNLDHAEWAMPPDVPTTAAFDIHPLHPGALALSEPYLGGRREVQIWRNGSCAWWGVPIGAELIDPRTYRVHCVHLTWWLLRRQFGPIINNYLEPNADFEDGMTGWTSVGVTAVPSTEWRAKGTQSAKLTQATAGTDTYIYRRHAITTTTQDVYLEAKALLHLSATGWVGPALYERGLYLEVQQPAGTLFPGVEPQWHPITNRDAERGNHDPIRMLAGITVPSGGSFAVEARLYAPGTTGGAYYDHTALSPEESTGSAVTGDLASVILTRIAQYAQDPTWGKSDLLMPVVVEPGTTPTLIRIYQHYDQGNVLEAMSDFPKEGTLDWDVVYPPDGSSRFIRVWPGQRGAPVPGAVLTLPGNAVKESGYSSDCSNIVTAPRRIGSGRGATQEVARVVDASGMDGHILEGWDTAPAEANVDSLWKMAQRDLDLNKNPGRRGSLTVPADSVFGTYWLGDTVTPVINYGAAQLNATRRVGRLRLSGDDSMEVSWQ